MTQEALKLALEAIKEALAQPEQKPQPPTMATPRPGASDHLHVRSRGV